MIWMQEGCSHIQPLANTHVFAITFLRATMLQNQPKAFASWKGGWRGVLVSYSQSMFWAVSLGTGFTLAASRIYHFIFSRYKLLWAYTQMSSQPSPSICASLSHECTGYVWKHCTVSRPFTFAGLLVVRIHKASSTMILLCIKTVPPLRSSMMVR